MNFDVIAIIVAIVAIRGRLAGLIRPKLSRVHRDIADLRESMVRLESLFMGFTGRTAL